MEDNQVSPYMYGERITFKQTHGEGKIEIVKKLTIFKNALPYFGDAIR